MAYGLHGGTKVYTSLHALIHLKSIPRYVVWGFSISHVITSGVSKQNCSSNLFGLAFYPYLFKFCRANMFHLFLLWFPMLCSINILIQEGDWQAMYTCSIPSISFWYLSGSTQCLPAQILWLEWTAYIAVQHATNYLAGSVQSSPSCFLQLESYKVYGF